MNLRATHYGYTYQDLLTGIAFVDLLLGTSLSVTVDVKGFEGDRFDDLTIEHPSGSRMRVQIKHTSQDRRLAKSSFTGDGRSLRLDALFKSVLEDVKDHPDTAYRVVVRDGVPDSDLAEVLKPVEQGQEHRDPIPGIATQSHKFDANELRKHEPWSGLVSALSEPQLELACKALTVDTDAPASTISITDPGPAEVALLQRVREELGAGRPPNTQRQPEDVALALIHAATAARTLNGEVRREDLSPRIGLSTDFGAVAAGYPVERTFAVSRTNARLTLRESIIQTAAAGGRAVLSGEPGTGKSWLCEQLADEFHDSSWIVARHHCWLGPSDIDRMERVSVDVVVGSLLAQIDEQAPESTADLRPRFAATVESLEAALQACRDANSDRNILLIVDGLDHADRVLGRNTTSALDPSQALVDQLASIALPIGVAMLISSQPGAHLDNAAPLSGDDWEMPRMTRQEVAQLAGRHRLLSGDFPEGQQIDADVDRAIIDAVFERSGGNALYATYLCRFARGASSLVGDLSAAPTPREIMARLDDVPSNATDLDAYYSHLLSGLTDGQEIAIGTLAVCDFALDPVELAEMVPEVALMIDGALASLAPVLTSQPGLGGLKVHHESFSRHILHGKPDGWVSTIRSKAVLWLQSRGFMVDARAFRNIPPLLAALDRYDDLRNLVTDDFVGQAICALQPPAAVKRVIGVLAQCSEKRLDWPTLIRCIELRKAIAVYEEDSLPDTLVHYGDVVVSILGADRVAERLLYDGRSTFAARWGLQLCRLIDESGTSAPWRRYIRAHEWEAEAERVSYSAAHDTQVRLARQLGSLRVREQDGDFPDDFADRVAAYLDDQPEAQLGSLAQVFNMGLPSGSMTTVAAKMTDPARASTVYIALADLSAAGGVGLPTPLDLARTAQRLNPGGDLMGLLRLGIPANEIAAGLGINSLDAALAAATNAITTIRYADYNLVSDWLSTLSLAYGVDRTIPVTQTRALSGIGFYRAWLRFVVSTVGLTADVAADVMTPQEASASARIAFSELAAHAKPFTGSPRACDLYSIHPLIHESFERALSVVGPDDLHGVSDDLLMIGNGTTTSLKGMAGSGPLTTNDLLEVLARLSDSLGADHVHDLIQRIRESQDMTEGMYSTHADFELAAARICLQASASDEAKDCWGRASTLLAGYGGRKDPTIFEYLETVEDLDRVNALQAREALEQLLGPVYLVRQHTDGAGTSHAPLAWWETLARVDPISAAFDGAHVWMAELGLEDARVQTGLEELLETRATRADPVVMAALRMAAGSDWRRPEIDVEILRRLQPEYAKTATMDALLASIANNIAASYDDQPVMYSNDATASEATPQLVEAVRALGGMSLHIRPAPRNKADAEPSMLSERRQLTELVRRLESAQRPVLPEGPEGAVLAAREYSQKRYDDDGGSPRWSFDAVVSAIGWRVIELVESDSEEAGIALLNEIAREVPSYGDNGIFEAIGEGLAMRSQEASTPFVRTAAHCMVMAYARIRGGGGWRTFAGREHTSLWVRAHALDPRTAEQTLAAAIAGAALDPSASLYGVAQGVIAAFAAQPAGGVCGTAFDCWSAGFSVLRERLPGIAERSHHSYSPSVAVGYESASLDDALATLAIASISQPIRADLRRALLALTLLVVGRPDIAQSALVRVFSHPLDAARQTWLLEVLQACLENGALSEDMGDTLSALCREDRLSVRVIAREILVTQGEVAPEARVTEPAVSVRTAFTRLLGAAQ